MYNKIFLLLCIFINISINLHADEKQLIIDRLINLKNITFNFEQVTNKKKEVGTCILVFNNKLICDYDDSMWKRIIINEKTLVVQQKRYNKIYFYPISNSLFIEIFNKNNLVNLIKKSDYQLNSNIELTSVNKNGEKIIIFFNKDNHNLLGWRVVDQLKNIINFSIKIKYSNSEINPEIFKIPTAY